MFMDIFKIESATKILQMQNIAGSILNKAIFSIASSRGLDQFKEYSLKFKSPIQNLIEQVKEAEEDVNINSSTGNQAQSSK